MDNWQEKHFGVPDGPKKIRPADEPERSGAGFWFFLFLLIATPIGAVAIAYHLGYIGAPPTIIETTAPRPPAPVVTQERVPAVNVTYTAKIKEPEVAPRTITQARANELNRLITSRTSGIDLMTRDRSKAITKEQAGQSDLAAAKDRLLYLERNRPASSNTGAVYQWNLAHADAVAAGKNATTTIAAQQKVINSFNERIGKAKAEQDAAKDELDGATIIP